MNKIFKVVWSKTKECYVVVSEVAKNNGGKKKVLATVFAALVATGSMLPDYVDAANNTSGGGVSNADASIAIGSGWGDSAYANTNFSIAIGDQSNATGEAAIALGRKAKTNGEQASIAIGNQTEAIAKDSTAVGSGSKSSGEYAAALGFQTKATANYATAIGSGARGYAEDSQAIGREAETSAGALRAIAIGTLSKSSGNYATSLGSSAEATAERAIAVGYKSKAEAERAISVGNLANATKNDSIAVGNNSAASGLNASAVGKNSKASGQSAAAFGDTAQATNTNATAVGNQANASNTNTTAIGNQTVASGGNATAVGHLSQATADGATAIGTNNKAGYEGTAVGLSNTVTGRTSAAFGRSNTVSGKESLAAGVRSTASGEHNVAIGYQAATDGKATVAIGEGSKADIADGVALGSNSATTAAAGIQGFNPADSRTNTYGGLSGTAQTSTLGAVAVGNGATATRQITGLAAGKENTDAVNVAQLRSVNLKYAGNSGNSDVLLDNGTLNIKGEGLLSTTADGTGITVKLTKGDDIAKDNGKAKEPTNNGVATTQNVVQAINNSYWKATAGGNTDGTPAVGNVKPGTQVTYSAGDNLKVKQTINATTGDQEYKYSLNPVLTGITSIANTTTGPKMTFGGNSINITGGSLDMGTNKITNLAPGTADNDAVNVKQLKDTELHITPGTYTPDANKKVKLTYTDGNNTVVTGKEAVIDLSGLATGGTASTEKVKKAANGANDTNIAEVNPQTGDTYGAAGATYEVSVSRNAVKDAAREAVTVNNGGTTTGGTYTADTNNPISVTAVPDNTNHNTTYAVTFDGNKAAKQIPLTYKATNGTITTADQTVKLDKGLNFTGGDYTTASVGADGKVTFDVNLGTAPTVTDGKPGVPGQAGAAGKDGIATVKTVVDTINNSGWKANAKANGGTLVGNSTATVVKPGDQVNFAAGKNLTVKQDLTGEHTYTYSLNKDIDLTNAGSLTVGDTKVNNDGITIKAPTPAAGTTATTTDVKLTNTGLDNGGNKIVNVAEGTADTDAVNVKQLKDAKTVLADGKNTKKSGTGTAADPYKVNVEGDLTEITSITNKADASGNNAGKITFSPNQTVTVSGDHNISLNGKTGDITGLTNTTIPTTAGSDFATKGRAATEEQLKIVNDKFNNKINLGADGSTETTKLALDNNGGIKFNIKGDGSGASGANQYISTTANGSDIKVDLTDDAKAKLNKSYDVKSTDKSVTVSSTTTNGVTTFDLKVAPVAGTTSTWDIKSSADTANGGATATGHETNAKTIANTNSVEMIAGKNLTVKQTSDTNGAKVEFALSDEIAVGKDGANGVDGKIGVNGKDGASVVINGKDGSIGLTGPRGATGAPGASATLKVKDGVPGVDGAPGTNLTRIVYTDKNNVEHEVATHDDGMKFAGDDGQANQATNANVIKKHLNNVVDIIGGATKTDLTTNNIGVNNDGNGKLLVQLSKNLNGINTVKNGNTTITLNDAPGGATNTPAVTISGGNLSMGDGTHNNKIVNVAPGTDDSDAVNYKQLKAAKTEVKAGKNVVVTSETSTTDGHTTYTVNASTPAVYTKPDGTKLVKQPDGTFKDENGNAYTGSVIASFEDGTGATTGGNMIVNNVGSAIKTQTGGDFLTKLDNANTATPNAAVNVSDLKSTADALKANERHIAPTTVATGSTETKGGTANAAGTANVYKYDAASKTVTLTYNDGNGNAVTDTKAVIDLSNLSTGGTGASSWNVKSSANTTDGGAVDVNHNANAQNIADGKSVEFQSGKNLVVKQTNDTTNGNATVEFSLSDNITVGKDGANGKDGSVGAKGADGSAVVMNGKDGSIGLNGTNGANGISIKGKDGANGVGIDGKDGVTRIVYTEKVPDPANPGTTKEVTHEVATMDDGLKFTGNNTATENKHKLGSLVKVQGEGVTAADEAAFQSASGNIAVTANGSDTLTIRLNKNLKGLNSIQLGGNTIQSNGDNITFTTNGGTTKTVATTDQLWTIQANGTDVPAKSGKVNLVAGDHITITPDAANGKMTISATGFGSMDGFNVKTSAESATVGTHAGDTTQNIKNGKTVDMQAGKNLVVTQTNDGNGNTTVNYALNKDVDLGTNGSLKTGDTTINNDGFKNGNTTVGGNGMTIKNPTDPTKTVSLTKDGLNNGGNQITNVASGGNVDTNAANIGDIKRLAKDTRIQDGTYTVDNNGTVELTYVDGAGNQVKDASGNAITAKITGITTLDSTRVNVAVDKTGSGKVVGATTPVKVTKGTEFVAGDNLIVERKARTGNDLDNSVVYSLNSNLTGINSISNTSTGPKMTFGGNSINVTNGDLNMGGNKITKLGKGTAKDDAATVGQLTKVTSNNHSVVVTKTTDADGAPVYDLAVTGTPGAPAADPRVDMLGEEIGRVGAQGAALSALKPIQYDPLEPTQIMAGYGNYRGNSAVALGVAHYKNESTLIHGGVSWAGGSSHMMANAGVTWKVGNRDSEAAVADRYRKGPISSAYAMQQEMAAMKAQNAGLKGEVSDLKAENEQMKAQIAAMMAKLGL